MNTTILLLASDPIIRKVIRDALESEGYSVLAAGDVGTAVDRLKECTPDLLMVRNYVENMSGHDAAMYLRRVCPGVPVLIVGGILDDDRLENRAILQGFEVFPKPFQASELLDKVKELMFKGSPRS
ncbi:MAG: response regulator [Bryobacteraceae bacterium]